MGLRNQRLWKFNRNLYIFIPENGFKIVVSKMAAILSRRQCVKALHDIPNWLYRYWYRGCKSHYATYIKSLLYQILNRPCTIEHTLPHDCQRKYLIGILIWHQTCQTCPIHKYTRCMCIVVRHISTGMRISVVIGLCVIANIFCGSNQKKIMTFNLIHVAASNYETKCHGYSTCAAVWKSAYSGGSNVSNADIYTVEYSYLHTN